MERQLNAPLESLPESIQSLFDAAQPLSQEVWFQPRTTGMRSFLFNLIFTGMFAGSLSSFCGICMLIALAGSVLDGTQKIKDFGDVAAIVFLALLFASLVVVGWTVFWRPLWIERQTLREQQAGILRRGVFLTPDAMIVRIKAKRCDIIPRDTIADLGFIGGRWREWKVYCHAPSGVRTDPYGYIEYILDFPPFDQAKPEPAAITKIREWAASGGKSPEFRSRP